MENIDASNPNATTAFTPKALKKQENAKRSAPTLFMAGGVAINPACITLISVAPDDTENNSRTIHFSGGASISLPDCVIDDILKCFYQIEIPYSEETEAWCKSVISSE